MVFDMEINDYETHILFLGALQYSMTRQSYIVGSMQSIIKDKWNELESATKERIIYFVNDAIKYKIMPELEIECWVEFLVWCRKNFKGE